MARALSIVAFVSKERSASTSVETRPGTMPASSAPKATASRSQTAADHALARAALPLPQASASSTTPHRPDVGRLEEEGRVGGAILRLQAAHRFDVAGIGDDDRHLAQLFELGGHGVLR